VAPERSRLANRIQSDDRGGAGTRHHEGGKNPEKSSLTTAVWAKQPK
jgi:hypothetical protein